MAYADKNDEVSRMIFHISKDMFALVDALIQGDIKTSCLSRLCNLDNIWQCYDALVKVWKRRILLQNNVYWNFMRAL